jgi:hypothetical protein
MRADAAPDRKLRRLGLVTAWRIDVKLVLRVSMRLLRSFVRRFDGATARGRSAGLPRGARSAR